MNRWLIRSDYLCADYQLQLSRAIRDTRLATDFLATVLAGLATDLAMMANAIAVDNGTFTQQTQEDGNLTLFAEFPGICGRNNSRVPALSSSRGCPSRASITRS